MSEFTPPPVMNFPHETIRQMTELAKSAGAVVVWRHAECRRVLVVVTEVTPDRFLTAFGMGRMMAGRDRERPLIAQGDDPAGYRFQSVTYAPAPVVGRCCGPMFTLDWCELWDDAEAATRRGRRVTRDVTFDM